MKAKRDSTPPRRQIFVLTPEEKKTIAFVLCAFILGLTVKDYRDAHPAPPRPLSVKEQRTAKKAAHARGKITSPPPLTK